ncbi:hypothetical protein GOP47_0017276 [Adiantum capillus-veneris]|uniref:Uncharacterized protein n=1 Tax=Adiantum capillus-veneris TaxID=13818 RepID=A0A9D4UEZ4_ADICA|nr:hypothetical protein GOP47_0017276 [Adiantum capillus-veneris]
MAEGGAQRASMAERLQGRGSMTEGRGRRAVVAMAVDGRARSMKCEHVATREPGMTQNVRAKANRTD